MRIQYNPLEIKISGKLDKMFQKENCFIQAQPGNVTLPKKFSEIGEAILDLEVRKDDIWVVSYPRTGKTHTKGQGPLRYSYNTCKNHVLPLSIFMEKFKVCTCTIIKLLRKKMYVSNVSCRVVYTKKSLITSFSYCCFISVYLQTGSTWAQEMVWLLGNNLDYESAKQLQVTRSPLLELTAIFAEDHTDWLKLRYFFETLKVVVKASRKLMRVS